MMIVRGLGALDVGLIGVFVAGVAAAAWILVADPRYALLAPVAVLLLGVAATCRAIGRRRWQSIDWTRFRPPRQAFQGMRP